MIALASGTLAHAAAFALLSSLWQGAVIVAGTWIGLLLLGRASAHTRYVFVCGCMVALVAVPAATGVRTFSSHSGEAVRASRQTTSARDVSSAPRSGEPAAPGSSGQPMVSMLRAIDARQAAMPVWLRGLVLAIWLTGVTIQILRLMFGLRGTYRLARTATPAPRWLEELGADVAQLVRVRACVIRASAQVTMPLVIGIVRPIVLIPVGFVSGVPAEVLRALIAHELAHVRRHDFVLNLLQRVAEALLFYHPAMWWLSRRVRDEREHCCDDVAAAAVRDRRAVARALVAAEEMRNSPSPVMALAATDGWLSRRVRRLLNPAPALRDSGAVAVAAVPLLFALLAVPAGAARQAAAAGAEWQEVWSGSIRVDAWLRVYNLHGPITVERGAVERAVVLARQRGTEVQITTSPVADGIAICVMQPDLGECNADGMIWRGSQEELERSVTELRVIVPAADAVEAAAHAGDVILRGGAAPVVARTGAGTIDVGADGANVEAASGGGRIRITGGSDVAVRSANGDVELIDIRGDARVRTTRGSVVASLGGGSPGRGLDIGTGNGSVRVTLPSDMRGTLSASAGTGSLQLDYPSGPGGSRRERSVLIGGGGRPMSITTGSGDITVTPR